MAFKLWNYASLNPFLTRLRNNLKTFNFNQDPTSGQKLHIRKIGEKLWYLGRIDRTFIMLLKFINLLEFFN